MPNLVGMSVVITGASSGIGKATALAFARRGASVTLASRRGGRLAVVARNCERLGGRAQYVETDVTSADATAALARAAARRFGGIDVWVNNAGIGAVGRFTQVPVAAHDQVIRTNLMGYLHGAHAALPFFEKARRGTLINVVSFAAFAAPPYGASYAATKFGLRGLSESLRGELANEPDIHVCDVFPGFVDTPGVGHAANYTGHRFNVVAPDRPEQVADAIVRLASKPRPKTSVGATAKLAPLAYAMAPGLGRWVMNRALGLSIANAREQAPSSGSLFAPGSNGGRSRHVPVTGIAGTALLVAAAAAIGSVVLARKAR